MQLEIWSDIACPWCFIGKTRFAAALEKSGRRDQVDVVWRSYQLSPETPVGLAERELDALMRHKGMGEAQVTAMFAQVAAVAAGEGLHIDFDSVIAANTFDAHRLIKVFGSDDLVDALFRAHFLEGLAIDDVDVLVGIVESVGIEGAREALESDAGASDVQSDIDTARELQVSGVPFFVADRRIAVSGAQSEDVFTQLLDQAV